MYIIYIYIYIHIICAYIPQTKTARQGRGSYFSSIIIPLCSSIARRQPTCLDLPSPAANSVKFRIARRQPKCLDLLSLAANSLTARISCRRLLA